MLGRFGLGCLLARRLVEKGVFGYPRSPYLPLLKLARCELGDIESMVRSRGLEHTLHTLRNAGVYFTFEEFEWLSGIPSRGLGSCLPVPFWRTRSDFN